MQKPPAWLTITLVVVAVLLFLGVMNQTFFWTYKINTAVNSLHKVDYSCSTDADCTMKETDCSICSCGSKVEAVNKNYDPWCPLPNPAAVCCMMAPNWPNYKTACVNNRCTTAQE